MSNFKLKIHATLDSLLHLSVKDGKSRKAEMVIPYYELCKELGFGEAIGYHDLTVTIYAKFSEEEDFEDGENEEFAVKNKICN